MGVRAPPIADAEARVYHSLSAMIALLSLSSDVTESASTAEPSSSDIVLYDPPLFSAEIQLTDRERGWP